MRFLLHSNFWMCRSCQSSTPKLAAQGSTHRRGELLYHCLAVGCWLAKLRHSLAVDERVVDEGKQERLGLGSRPQKGIVRAGASGVKLTKN